MERKSCLAVRGVDESVCNGAATRYDDDGGLRRLIGTVALHFFLYIRVRVPPSSSSR